MLDPGSVVELVALPEARSSEVPVFLYTSFLIRIVLHTRNKLDVVPGIPSQTWTK
jgi:hypothetical protein